MSKSASRRTTSKRAHLTVIKGGAPRSTPPRFSWNQVVKSASHAELRAELRRLRAELISLVTYETEHEVPKGKPGYRRYEEAREDSARTRFNLDQLTRAITARPRRTLEDAGLLAEAHVAQSLGPMTLLDDDLVAGMTFLEQKTLALLVNMLLELGSAPTKTEAASLVQRAL